MSGLLERLLPAKLTMEAAEQVARAECERRGWEWKEPVIRRRGLRGYRFWTNAKMRGGNVEIVVDANTGEIRRAWLGVR
jgi:hypothetical protein